MVEQICIGVGEHVGRESERQGKGHFEGAAEREVAGGHQPGAAGADEARADPDKEDELYRCERVTRQHRAHQPVPGVGRAGRGRNRHRDDRCEACQRNDPGSGLECAFAQNVGSPGIGQKNGGRSRREREILTKGYRF